MKGMTNEGILGVWINRGVVVRKSFITTVSLFMIGYNTIYNIMPHP
jgi:hypothetical protein